MNRSSCFVGLAVACVAGLAIGFAIIPARALPMAPAGAHGIERQVALVRAHRRARRHAPGDEVPPSASQKKDQREDQKKDAASVPLSAEPGARRRTSAISPPPPSSPPRVAPNPSGDQHDQQGQSTKPPVPEAQAVWSDAEVIGALRRCLQLLAPTTAAIEVLDPLRNAECGTPAPVRVKRIGGQGGVDISPPAIVNCSIVARLHDWIEGTLQPAAEKLLASRITRIVTASSYDCRNRIGTPTVRISEHAFANAVDISGVVTADGRRIDVLTDWGATQRDKRAQQLAKETAEQQYARATKGRESQPPQDTKAQEPPSPRPRAARREASSGHRRGSEARSMADVLPPEPVSREAAFLRALHRGACGVFGTVLGPEANDAHRNHLHFDLAPRRRGALCE